MDTVIATTRLFEFINVRKRDGWHLRRYELVCDDEIILSSHFAERAAREALRRNDLDALAFECDNPGVYGQVPLLAGAAARNQALACAHR